MISNNLITADQYLDAGFWMLIHSIWQFTIIGIIIGIILNRSGHQSAQYRYNLGIVGLMLMLTSSVCTYIFTIWTGTKVNLEVQIAIQNIVVSDLDHLPQSPQVAATWWQSLSGWIYEHKLVIFISWLAGTILLISKLLLSVTYIYMIKKNAQPIYSSEISLLSKKISAYFGIKNPPQIMESTMVTSPMLIGFVKPIILLPIATVNLLNIAELEAVIAHEMSHFFRKDIIINLLQHLMESIFYYHPAVWWVSNQVRMERENCCDDDALKYTKSPLIYAKTLIKIQEMLIKPAPVFAMNLTQKGKIFSNRINRILNMNQSNYQIKSKLISLSIVSLILFVGIKNLLGAHTADIVKIFNTVVSSPDKSMSTNDTVPRVKENFMVQRIQDDKSVKLSMENGNITNLEIDGKIIPPTEYDQYQSIIEEVKPSPQGAKAFKWDNNFKGLGINGFDGFEKWGNMDSLNSKMLQLQPQIVELQKNMGKNFQQFHFDFGDMENGLRHFEFNIDSLVGMNKNLFLNLDSMNFNFDGLDGHGEYPNVQMYKWDSDDDREGNNFHQNRDYNDFPPNHNKNSDYSTILGNALNHDGLLIAGRENSVELTGKHLKINGEKQPSNLWNKYKGIFEDESGLQLERNSKLIFKIMGKESKRKYRVY